MRDSFSYSFLPALADVYSLALMEDTRGGCISHKYELPILHGVSRHGVSSFKDSFNSLENISVHDC